MNEARAHEAILQLWQAGWEALHVPNTPTEVKWTPTNELYEAEPEWARIAIVPQLSKLSAFGAFKRWTRSGTIAVQIFTRTKIGAQRISQLADDVRTVLEGRFITIPEEWRGDPVVTYAGSSGSPQSDGVWLMQVVTVPYSFDEVRGQTFEEEPVPSTSKNYRYVATGGELSVAFTFPEARANANYNAYCQLDGASDAFVTPDTTTFTTSGFTFACGAALTAGDVVMIEVEDLS